MKKILLLAAAAMLAVAANAQLMTSRTFFGKESNTTWFMRAGMSLNNVANAEDAETGIGFDVDFGFQKPIASSAAYWGMELGIGTRGCGIEHYDETCTTYGVKWSPLTFGYKWAVTDNIKIDPHVGAFLEYDFAKSDAADSFNEFDAGLQIGAGVWFKRFNLDFTYQRGFCAIFDVPDGYDTPTSSNFMIRVGFAF